MSFLTRRSAFLVSLAVEAAMLLLSLWGWLEIPAGEPVPVHWGFGGEPDRYGGKFEALLLLPLITLAVMALLWVVPRIEPRREHLAGSEGAYAAVWLALVAFMGLLHIALVLNATGREVDIGSLVPGAIGALDVVIGAVLGRVRSNYMFGVRTPWTLSSERSWEATHRLAGRLFVASGLTTIVAAALGAALDARWLGFAVLLTGLGITVAWATVYSYVVWRGDPGREGARHAR